MEAASKGESTVASIEQDVTAYEGWLRKQCDVIERDLKAKHRRMRKSAFDFLRATYFRWARTIEATCPTLTSAPVALCIGDIHVENYGTWRDAEARLVWGINDFDEAAVMPYAFDLVRLATSAILIPDLQLPVANAVEAVLKGYRRGLSGPRAVLPDEDAGWLRSYANPTPQSNSDFWQEVDGYPDATPPADVQAALTDDLPHGARMQRFAARTKGGGSLGRPRFLAIASWNSGRVVREAKAQVPSAWTWAHETSDHSRFLEVAFAAFRSPDPYIRSDAGFILRRIAPDSRKIEIADVQVHGLTEDLLAAMAGDLASVHAASEKAEAIVEDLDSRARGWLQEGAEAAKAAAEDDFAAFCQLD
jgi:hypothetical protein